MLSMFVTKCIVKVLHYLVHSFTFFTLASCPADYEGKYGPDDQTCPCGKFAASMCKTGLIIPLWMGDNLDAYVTTWAQKYVSNPAFAHTDSKNRLTSDDCLDADDNCEGMYFIADQEDASIEERIEAIKESGVIVVDNLTTGNKMARGFTYFLILVYFFMGVAIVADKFMASIEVITSQEKTVKVKQADGTTKEHTVR